MSDAMKWTPKRKVLFRELSQNVDGEVDVAGSSEGGISFFMDAGGDCHLEFDSEKAAELVSLLTEAVRIAEDSQEKWKMVGSVRYTKCDWDDPTFDDNRGFVVVEARQGEIKFTIRADPRSDEPDWPVVIGLGPARDFVALLQA
ncbi:MAG: hypothetical protein E3J35_08975 [Methanomassiliicoccales archaeon]|nr:MAG: hypothetical protein E3J35_08975 [Methanomassiliicoccales archaeon]